jgi:hypothetical protein
MDKQMKRLTRLDSTLTRLICVLLTKQRIRSSNNKTSEAVQVIMEGMEIVLSRDSDFQQLSRTIRSEGALIRSIKLLSPLTENPSNEPDWNSDPVRALFMEISSLPNIEAILLQNFGMYSDSVPIHLLSILLATEASLLSFQLNCVCLMGTCNDIDELARNLKDRQTLQSFRLSYCGFSTTVPSSCTIDAIVMALSTLSTLKSLELWSYAEGSLGILQRHTLSQLLATKSSSLEELHVEGFTLGEEMAQAIAIALRNNSSLKKLDLHIVKQAPTGCLLLADALHYNNTLQALELFLSTLDGYNVFLSQLAYALLSNTSLQAIRIHCNQQVTSLVEEAFANMLETNTDIQFLHLSGFEGDCRPKIEYFLTWNRRGGLPLLLQREICQRSALRKSRQQQEGQQQKGNSKRRQHLNHA